MLHLEEFQPAALKGYIDNVPPAREYLLSRFLPVEETEDLDFAFNIINGKYGKAASLTGWNAAAPLRDKKSFETAMAEVVKVQHGQRLDERQLLKFKKPRSENEQGRALSYVYDTTEELSQGVDDIIEYMRAQALYSGGMSYHDDLNDIHIDFELDLPENNRITVTTPWDQAGAKPLADVQAAVKQFQAENQRRKPAIMHMTSATEALLLQNESIRVQIYGAQNGGQLLTPGNVQAAFSALGLPSYEINDDVVEMESGEVQLLEDGKVVLLGAELGKTFVGPTVENDYEPGKFVSTVIKVDPPEQKIIIGQAVYPAVNRPQAIVIMSV